MHVINILLIIIYILLACLACYVYFRNPKEPIVRSFFIIVFGGAIWTFANSFYWKTASDFITKLTYISATVVMIGLVYFSLYFPYRSIAIKIKHHLLILLPGLFFITSLFVNDWLVIGYSSSKKIIITGPIFEIFTLYFLLNWFWATSNLYKKYKKSDGIYKWQLKKILLSLTVTVLCGSITNLILPSIGIWGYNWVGPFFTLIFFGFASYILFKKNIKRV